MAPGFFESMGTILQLLNVVEKLDFKTEVPKIVEQTSYEIIALNQLQLYAGLNSDGSKIEKKYKSKSYAAKKNAMNPDPGLGTPDLFLTGAHYKGMGVVVKQRDYLVNSKDSKADRLESIYGKKIYGLTTKHKEEYAKGAVYTGIKSYVETTTGLKFR